MKYARILIGLGLVILLGTTSQAQNIISPGNSLLETVPRWLADMPTAGTLDRGHFDIGIRIQPDGGMLGFTDIGLSNRFTLGLSYGGEQIVSSESPNWNPVIEFHLKFRIIDELEMFPAVAVGFTSQGFGAYNSDYDRYTFKSRGFYAVASRSFFFMQWTSGWHLGANFSREYDVDGDKDLNFFGGVDATFKYNLALAMEYDAALNDDRSKLPDGSANDFGGKGRGYLNFAVKWLFAKNLELEALLKDLVVNRRESDTFTREIRLTYIDMF